MKLIMNIIIIQICVMKHLSWKESTHPPHPLVLSSPLLSLKRGGRVNIEENRVDLAWFTGPVCLDANDRVKVSPPR